MSENGEPENLAAIRQRLLRHLTANGDITALSRDFGALKSNYERVDFVVELFRRCGLKVELRKEPKSDEVAVKLREQGNEMFKRKRVKEAWECYTKSISFAEKNSVNLALAYANRSAVLFEVDLHKQCVMDINRALENNYPDHLKPKLFVRERNSKNLEIEAFKNPHEAIPTLPTKNPKIQSAANCIEIQESEALGRHVVATRDIKPGEILAVEKPFTVLLVNQFLNHCHECVNLCYNLIPCDSCTQALYCSDICKTRAFDSYHKYECPIIPTAKALELDKLKLLPLKIAFLACNCHRYDFAEEQSEEYRSDRYGEVHDLITNTSKRSIPDLFERATAAAVIFNLVKDHTSFFDNSKDERAFKETLLLHMQTGPSNFHEITELSPTPVTFEPEEIASGVFSFLSLLNHSCCPNVTRFCYGSTLVLRAVDSIKRGEQCFDNYGYHYAVTSKTERQKRLKNQYYFDCECPACRSDWALYDALPSVGKTEIDESMVAKLSSADLEAAQTVLQDSLSELRDFDGPKPCQNFCQMQEIVKQCFAVFEFDFLHPPQSGVLVRAVVMVTHTAHNCSISGGYVKCQCQYLLNGQSKTLNIFVFF